MSLKPRPGKTELLARCSIQVSRYEGGALLYGWLSVTEFTLKDGVVTVSSGRWGFSGADAFSGLGSGIATL